MKEHFVIDPLISKRQQLLLATQLCRMVLKVCIKISYCIIVCYAHPCPTHPFHVLPSVRPPSAFIPCLDQPRTLNVGEAGKLYTGSTCEVCATRYTRQAPFASVFVIQFTGGSLVYHQTLLHNSSFLTILALFHVTDTIDRSTM
jgi:hypothetical protein